MFGRKLVDRDSLEWQFEGFAWLIDHFSTGPGLPDSELWLPTDAHFPSGPEALAPRLFEHVKRHYGFAPHIFFDVTEVDAKFGGSMGGLASVQTVGDTACGTYKFTPKTIGQPKEEIHFRNDMEALELVSTFAHELAHAAHYRVEDLSAINDELYELFTDLTAIYFGFGVFLANSRFEMKGFTNADTQGWQAKGSGYLPESDLIFATALFMSIKEIPIDTALPHLKQRLHKPLRKAFQQLGKHTDRVAAVKTLEPTRRTPGEFRLGFAIP